MPHHNAHGWTSSIMNNMQCILVIQAQWKNLKHFCQYMHQIWCMLKMVHIFAWMVFTKILISAHLKQFGAMTNPEYIDIDWHIY
jgi:hypothetical protein